MKKMLIITFVSLIFLLIDTTYVVNKKRIEIDEEMRFIYISYLEYFNNFNGNSTTINKKKIDKMIDEILYYNFNTIILHVSPFSDAIYNSKIFPFSHTLTGKEGKNPGFDYLEYFIKKSHSKNIKIHAWINPYRISSKNDISLLSKENPAYKFINTEHISISEKGIYYDPTSELVKELIIEQVLEIINNYDVDGIHFDDYFYIDYEIDNYEYEIYKKNDGKLELKEFRLMHTNDLIKRVYEVIKKKKEQKQIIFSISPDGNINNNYLYHYADIKTWLSEGYVDIIMPQIYYGFDNQYLPFDKAYENWNNLLNGVKMVPVLAYYKLGTIDNNAGKGKEEWLQNKVISRQITNLKMKDNYYGFGLFRYDFIFNKNIRTEIGERELQEIIKIM